MPFRILPTSRLRHFSNSTAKSPMSETPKKRSPWKRIRRILSWTLIVLFTLIFLVLVFAGQIVEQVVDQQDAREQIVVGRNGRIIFVRGGVDRADLRTAGPDPVLLVHQLAGPLRRTSRDSSRRNGSTNTNRKMPMKTYCHPP